MKSYWGYTSKGEIVEVHADPEIQEYERSDEFEEEMTDIEFNRFVNCMWFVCGIVTGGIISVFFQF